MKKRYIILSLFLVGILMYSSLVSADLFNWFGKDKSIVGQTYIYGYIREQVKCVFYDTTEKQECYSEKGKCTTHPTKCEIGQKCSSMATCTINVSGKKGEQITWKSTCGGYAYTTIDGQNEYAKFRCKEDKIEFEYYVDPYLKLGSIRS